MIIENKPGPSWDVTYMEDGASERMVVFGVATPELALAEARFSLDDAKIEIEIISVVRRK